MATVVVVVIVVVVLLRLGHIDSSVWGACDQQEGDCR